MNVPKPRPASPHSLRCSMSSARRQRAAAKPTTVTMTKRTRTIVNTTVLTLLIARLLRVRCRSRARRRRSLRCSSVATQSDERHDRHVGEQVEVEEGEVAELRRDAGVDRDYQRAAGSPR